MKSLTPEEILTRRFDAIESLQSAIVNSGGKFFTRKELEGVKFGELLNITIPNLVKINAVYDSDTYIKLQQN